MQILEALIRTLGAMSWAIFWALALGFILSSLIQTYVPRETIIRRLGQNSFPSTGLATLLGAISSSCSFAAASMGRTLFGKGATLSNAIAFMVASTNLVFEIFAIILALMGWHFVLGELVGGLFFISLAALGVAYLIPKSVVDSACAHNTLGNTPSAGCCSKNVPEPTHSCENPSRTPPKAQQSEQHSLKRAAHHFYTDVNRVGKDILISVVVASLVIVIIPISFWNTLFLKSATPGIAVLSWNALVGIAVAMLTFACSCGNILLAAALWHGGISFGGVIAFILSDLLTIPMLRVYKTYYGKKTTLYLFLILSGCILLTALFLDYSFGALNLIPQNPTQSLAVIQNEITWNYRTLLNLLLIPLTLGYYFWGKRQKR